MRRRLLALAGALLVAVLATGLAGDLGRAWDLTAEGSGTLSATTLDVLDDVDTRIEITAFYARDTVGRVEAATLLSRYRNANRRITFRVLDPTLAPGEAQRLGVTTEASAAVVDLGTEQVQIAPLVIEIDVTSAIARLLRDVTGTICFATGHGERDRSDASAPGLAFAAELLADNGYELADTDLLADPAIPDTCDALVLAGPTAELGDEVVEAISAYAHSAGNLMVLTDPGSADLSALTEEWGIAFVSGVVIEGDAGSHLPDDVTSPIVSRYVGGNPAVRGLGPTYFPGVQGVRLDPPSDPGLTVSELALTSGSSYLDTGSVGSFDPDADLGGPIVVGAAANDTEVRDPMGDAEIKQTRIFAWGDVDFASNGFVRDAANARLFVQAVDWLTQPEDLVTAVPVFPKVRELDLTEARSRYILLLMAVVVPGLFVVAGGFVWVLRRGR